MLLILAQAVTDASNPSLTQYANLTATGIVCALLVWLITKAFPAMFERHDQIQQATMSRFELINKDTKDHFERILTNIDQNRTKSAQEGHDAAKHLSRSIDESTVCIKDNTRAVEELARKVVSINVFEHAKE
jgi:uncharacterized membrane protein YhiD involved in acid resistance